ncbi:hypothetical protein CISIN_1g0396141mg, partial [Citrus sinensis]
ALVVGALRFRWPGMRVHLEASEDYSKRSSFLGCLCLIFCIIGLEEVSPALPDVG